MKNLIMTALGVLLMNVCIAQDATIELSSFTSIDVSEGIDLTMRPGDPKAEITVKKGDIEDIIVSQSGTNVEFGFKKQKWSISGSKKRDVDIILYYDKHVSDVDVSSGASVKCIEVMHVDEFEGESSSGGSISMNVESQITDVDVSSGGAIKLGGETKNLSVDVSSGGSYKGYDLKADNVDADASSGGSAKVWVINEINATASSGGSVKYKGDPKKQNIDSGKWSGGSVHKTK